MDDIVIAFTDRDAAAVLAVREHHAQLAAALLHQVELLVAAATRRDVAAAQAARAGLLAWCQRELVPHAMAEEAAMYPAAMGKPEGRLLVAGMLAEHTTITELLADLELETDLVRGAALATALRVVFDSHLRKENDLVLPLLAGAPDVSLATLLAGMHELLGNGDHEHDEQGRSAEPGCGHSCTCGEADEDGHPELDVRAIPHAIRHATVFGALDSIGPGAGLVVVAPHDPLPLIAQIEDRYTGAFTVSYLTRGPDAWRIAFTR